MDLDAKRLYPATRWDEKPMYPKIVTAYAFTTDMIDESVRKFITQTITQGKVFLNVLYYNPSDLIFQHLPVRWKNKITKIKNGYFLDTLTSVDIQEFVKLRCRVIKINEGVIFEENFITTLYRKFIETLFSERLKNEDEGNDIMQKLVNLLTNSLYAEKNR